MKCIWKNIATKKLNLVLYKYSKEESNGLYLMIDGKWKGNTSFTDALEEVFD